MAILKKDILYFLATNGGVTFGGGEPLLRAEFIIEVLELGAKQWHVTLETSLNVPHENLILLFPYIDEYVVDIKDMNPTTYYSYTGRDNVKVKDNLQWLIDNGKADNITVRIPLIDGFNNKDAQDMSMKELSAMGIKRFDQFTYKIDIKR